MIHFVKGDMFEIDVDVRVNTVNCKGVMGAGVALAFKNRYPEMFLNYKTACLAGEIRPGTMHTWHGASGAWVINFPTKRHWREKSRYEDIEAGLTALHTYLAGFKGVRVALPALGCGNGGLDWTIVAPMIERHLKDLNAEIFVFEPADSLSLAKKSNIKNQEQVSRELEDIGFQAFTLPFLTEVESNLSVFVKGNAELLVDKWIALLTSFDMPNKEFSALENIAKQMGLSENPPTVGLIYQNHASEEVAEVFLNNGMAVVLLLPFSPRVRKRVGLTSDESNKITYAILSVENANEKKSIKLENLVSDVLRKGATSVILSDPNPQSYSKKLLKELSLKPAFFLKYGTQTSRDIKLLEDIGFRSIGRRPDTGEPNLNPLMQAQFSSNSQTDLPSLVALTTFVTAAQLRSLADLIDKNHSTNGVYCTFALDLLPIELSLDFRNLLDNEGAL